MDSFTFIDLFAGIGGIRIAFESVGGKCVFSSEYDRFSQLTYKAFFNETPDFSKIKQTQPPGDITKINPEDVRTHDILTGGFPCQPFSLAGVSKKQSLGLPHGFDDPTQGNLFFYVKEILAAKKPKAFLLENVKNLISHDHGQTFKVISDVLDRSGYNWDYRIIDAAGWIPQHRERIYIYGFRKPTGNQKWNIESFPEFKNLAPPIVRTVNLDQVIEKRVPARYTLGEKTWETLLRHKAHHEMIGQGFGYGLIKKPFKNKTTRTLSARYFKDGAEILIAQKGPRPRRLTPLECARLMGFPEEYQKYFSRDPQIPQPVSDTQAYHQFGNSVAVPVVKEIAAAMVRKLRNVGAIPE